MKFSKNVNNNEQTIHKHKKWHKKCATKFSSTMFFFWKLQFLKHLKHFLLKLCTFFCQLILEFWWEIWKWLKGHIWSVAKVVIRVGCATWNSNLKSYLVSKYLVRTYVEDKKDSFFKQRPLQNICFNLWPNLLKVKNTDYRRRKKTPRQCQTKVNLLAIILARIKHFKREASSRLF